MGLGARADMSAGAGTWACCLISPSNRREGSGCQPLQGEAITPRGAKMHDGAQVSQKPQCMEPPESRLLPPCCPVR